MHDAPWAFPEQKCFQLPSDYPWLTKCRETVGLISTVEAPAQQRSQVISSQNILEPGHPEALFSSTNFFLFLIFFSRRPQNTKAGNAAEIVSLSK